MKMWEDSWPGKPGNKQAIKEATSQVISKFRREEGGFKVKEDSRSRRIQDQGRE